MSNRINASIDLTKLGDAVRSGHSAIKVASNGKKYANVTMWINDTADNFGNDVSIQLNSTQEKRDAEGRVYIGNGKTNKVIEQAAPAAAAKEEPYDTGLPF